jgi:hypothetical protein
MKRLLRTVFAMGSSRAVTPIVIGFFFLLYIGIAFFTEEALITLMSFTHRSLILAGILALIPVNCLLRVLKEAGRHIGIHKALTGESADIMPALFDEAVTLPVSQTFADVSPNPDSRFPIPKISPSFPELQRRLETVGYKTGRSGNSLAAWRGASIFPARILFLTASFCLFTGILISITTRTSSRQMVVEGAPLPTPGGTGGMVERIMLANSSGPLLSRTLTMVVSPSDSGSGRKIFGLYPPSLYGGAFVYPRYLGLAMVLRFSAPDLQPGYENNDALNCYPPGKEDSIIIPDSPYRIIFSIPVPDAGSDSYSSYLTGKITLLFKLLKGKDVLFTGSVPGGGEFVRDGYRLAVPDIRRLVVTDYIGDYGVYFIWVSFLLFAAAVGLWLPIRLFFPRREILFRYEQDIVRACSRAEGRARRHAGVFHEALDLADGRKPAKVDM